MKSNPMAVLLTRGAAAILAVAVTRSLSAQAAGTVQIRQRDSSGARMTMPTRAVIDSIAMLMRELNYEAFGSSSSSALRRKIDALLPGSGMFMVRKPSGLPRGWVGFNAQGPKHEILLDEGDFIQYFAYPSIIAVDPESPAQRAGIAPGDLLMAYNGVDVRGRKFNLSQLLEPDRKLSVTIRRGGATKDYAMTVAKAPERIFQRRLEFGAMPDGPIEIERFMKGEDGPHSAMLPGMVPPPRMPGSLEMFLPGHEFIMSPNGAFGAVLSNVNPELARTLKLETGVLVNDVTESSPAFEAGLHAGDVIVAAAEQPVASIRALHTLIAKHLADQSIALQVMRERKRHRLTVRW